MHSKENRRRRSRAFALKLGVVLAPLMLSACTTGMGPKQTGGVLLGAAGGAALGAQVGDGATRTVATAVGTLLGAGIGSEVGVSLDRADYCYRYGC